MNTDHADPLPVVYIRDVDTLPDTQRWLCRTLWSRNAVGFIAAAAKSFKSLIALDLAVSVASGTPVLGRFAIEDAGTALVYLAEDALPHVRARIESLCRHRALDIATLPLAVITSPVLRLDTARDQERLRTTVERIRPRLLVLDPLVRLHGRDENDATQISALLGYFRDLQRQFDLALVIVHHTTKRQHSQPGQSLRGSSDLHAFGDSSWYLARHGDNVTLTVEHRSAPAPTPMALALITDDDDGNVGMHLEVRDAPNVPYDTPAVPRDERPSELEGHVVNALQARAEPASRKDLRAALRINNERLGTALCALEQRGVIRRTPTGWTLAQSVELPHTTRSTP